jgi:hypothetical protein
VVEKFLKFGGSITALSGRQVGLSTHIRRIQAGNIVAEINDPQLDGGSSNLPSKVEGTIFLRLSCCVRRPYAGAETSATATGPEMAAGTLPLSVSRFNRCQLVETRYPNAPSLGHSSDLVVVLGFDTRPRFGPLVVLGNDGCPSRAAIVGRNDHSRYFSDSA